MTAIKRSIGKINPRSASRVLIIIPGLLLIFHGLIIARVLPMHIVWAGKLTEETLLPLELVAIVISLAIMSVGFVWLELTRNRVVRQLVKWGVWVLFCFMVFNSVAGLFSVTLFERLLVPITVIYAVCLFRLAAYPDGLRAVLGNQSGAGGK